MERPSTKFKKLERPSKSTGIVKFGTAVGSKERYPTPMADANKIKTGIPSHVYSGNYNYKYTTKIAGRLCYREEKTAIPGKDRHRWYYIGYCDVAYVECYEKGTRVGTKDGSNFCVHMAHRRKFNSTGDWFDIEDDMHTFIIEQLEAKI